MKSALFILILFFASFVSADSLFIFPQVSENTILTSQIIEGGAFISKQEYLINLPYLVEEIKVLGVNMQKTYLYIIPFFLLFLFLFWKKKKKNEEKVIAQEISEMKEKLEETEKKEESEENEI